MELRYRLILASSSPRRRQLLRQAGYEFEVVAPAVDEEKVQIKGGGSLAVAVELAAAKANEVGQEYPGSIVIGADTVVDCEGQIIGKAADRNEAERIIRLLFSRAHKVITGVAVGVSGLGKLVCRAESTTVYPKKLSDRQISKYLDTQEWQGKAGAYGISETGDEFVERIEGSLTNVMGFPMELVEKLLGEFSVEQ